MENKDSLPCMNTGMCKAVCIIIICGDDLSYINLSAFVDQLVAAIDHQLQTLQERERCWTAMPFSWEPLFIGWHYIAI